MKMYLLISILLLSFLGCSITKPEPRIQEKKVLTEHTQKSSGLTHKKLTVFKENFTEENVTTRIFKNCFNTGKIHLNKSCKSKIDMFLKSTPLHKKRNIVIEVHTDKGGSQKKNLFISKKRAKNIATSLYYKEYKNSRVLYKGFGESKLLYDTQSKKADIENRRVVIKLRSKNFKLDTKEYKLFLKSKNKSQKIKVKKHSIKKVQKKHKLDILSYTGEADIGWIYFGKPSLAKKFTISCIDDKPLKVKHKAISKSKKSEFMSTFYDKKITTSFSGKRLEVYPMYVYENGKQPISNPILLIQTEKINLHFQTTVNTYRGTKGILYRIFVNGKKEVKCVDLVISYEDDKLSYGRVYMKNKKEFVLKP